LRKCGIHWDKLGNSRGTADIEFFGEKEAAIAIAELNSKFFINKNKIDSDINGQPMYVQYARRRDGGRMRDGDRPRFRRGGLRLGRRRDNNNFNNNNNNNRDNNNNNNNRDGGDMQGRNDGGN